MQLRLAGITKDSVIDGPGLRVVVFVQGCPHNCTGCHNAETHDSRGGYAACVDDVFADIATSCEKNKLIRGVTFSGGEPFGQSRELAVLAKRLKRSGLNIVTYTGYTFEELLCRSLEEDDVKALLEHTDILIDGPYMEKERDLFLSYRGSRNQRMVDVSASMAAGRTVIWQEEEI